MPHNHAHVLADWHMAEPDHVAGAIAAAQAAKHEWASWALHERAAVFLRAAELLNTTWRATLNAATMLGQSKTVFQAEIDAAAESVDFWRFNAHFAQELYAEQPLSTPAAWNMVEYRPLEGFVFAVTPVQLHVDCREPAHGAGAARQHGGVEARVHGDSQRLLPDAAARGRGAAARRHQLRARGRRHGLVGGAGLARSRRHPLHRQHGRVQRDVAEGRRQRGQLPVLPAPGWRNRRQGLHPGPRVGRPRGAGGGDRARRLRIPGTEVLGVQPHLRAQLPVARRARPRGGHHAADARRRRGRLPHVLRRGDRPQGAEPHQRLP